MKKLYPSLATCRKAMNAQRTAYYRCRGKERDLVNSRIEAIKDVIRLHVV